MSHKLSHINKKGEANMVDVGHKPNQERIAKATGRIIVATETLEQIKQNSLVKGDVLTVARIAGIQGAKQTYSLIPLCHSLQLTKVDVETILEENSVRVNSMVKCTGKTGVEMEALTAVNIALLTIYDMCKAVDKSMEITEVKLLEKTKK